MDLVQHRASETLVSFLDRLTVNRTLVVFLRLAFRLRKIGLKSLQGDDYLAVAVWLCFVGKSVALTMVGILAFASDLV